MAMQAQSPWYSAVAPLHTIMNRTMAAPSPEYFPGQTVPGINPWTQQGLEGLQAAAGTQSGYGQAAGDAWQNALTVDPMQEADPARNPYVRRMLGQNKRQVNQNLTRNMLPAITHGSVSTGTGLGNSADALARGVAAGDASTALANANASTLSNAYNTNQNRNLAKYQTDMSGRNSALGMSDQMMNNAMRPAQTMSTIGDFMRQYEQQQMNAAKQKWDYEQMEPWQQIQRQMGIIGPMGGMGGVSLGPDQDQGGSGFGQYFGGALAAAGLFAPGGGNLASMFSGGGGNSGWGGLTSGLRF